MEVSHSSITIGKEIGQGEFGIVTKAVAVGVRGCDEVQAVAVKVMRASQSPSDVNAFIREGMRLRDLDHPNVIKLLGVCLSSPPLMIILEYMTYGDIKILLRHCHENHVPLTHRHLLSLSLDVSKGFEYLQGMRFVHRDLAARNVLVNSAYKAKIGDFGITVLQ